MLKTILPEPDISVIIQLDSGSIIHQVKELSLLRKVNLTENRTLSEVEVSLLTGVCILRLRSGSK